MKKVLFATMISLFVFSSCTKYTADENIIEAGIKTTDVTFDVSTTDALSGNKVSGLNKSGAYNRNGAPVYVSGVAIKATYQEPVAKIVNGIFDFVNEGATGNAISMTIPLGSNLFEATSRTINAASNSVYSNNIDKANSSTKKEDYSAKLIAKQAIYAIFDGYATKTITTTDKNVAIAMTTDHARYSVVLETSDNYDVEMSVGYASELLNVKASGSSKASAIVLNADDLKGAKNLVITLKVYSKGKSILLDTINVLKAGMDTKDNTSDDVAFNTNAATNNTLVLNYNAEGKLTMQEVGITFSWTPMTEDGDVVDIN